MGRITEQQIKELGFEPDGEFKRYGRKSFTKGQSQLIEDESEGSYHHWVTTGEWSTPKDFFTTIEQLKQKINE